MTLGLSPYVTSTGPAQLGRRIENDRPSPLRIHKQRELVRPSDHRETRQHNTCAPPEFVPLQDASSSRLNIVKRRSLWALNAHASQNDPDEDKSDFPVRPYSVGPETAMPTSAPSHSLESYKETKPLTAEEAEEMLREASRTYSGASNNSISWNSFLSGDHSMRNSSGTESGSSVIRHVSSSTDGPSCTINMDNILPHVLSPHISIYTDNHGRYFGQECVWAAIEVSGILSHAYSADGTGSKPAQPKGQEHHLDLFFKHGCLHDLKIEVLAVEGTAVLDIFHEQSFPTILYAGSKVLVLAQIRINSKTTAGDNTAHRRQRSDELIADLESELGDSQMPYMKVKISYSHSAFSDYFGQELLMGVAQRCTRLETTVIGALKQHHAGSAWSPAPTYSTDSLKSVMQRYWNPEVVAEWI